MIIGSRAITSSGVSRASFRSAYECCEFWGGGMCRGGRMNWEQLPFLMRHLTYITLSHILFCIHLTRPDNQFLSPSCPTLLLLPYLIYFANAVLASYLLQVQITIAVRRLGTSNISGRTDHRRNEFNACHSAEVSPKASSSDS